MPPVLLRPLVTLPPVRLLSVLCKFYTDGVCPTGADATGVAKATGVAGESYDATGPGGDAATGDSPVASRTGSGSVAGGCVDCGATDGGRVKGCHTCQIFNAFNGNFYWVAH